MSPVLWDLDAAADEQYRFALGGDITLLSTSRSVQRHLTEDPSVSLVVIGPGVDIEAACQLAEGVRVDRPELGVILLRRRLDVTTLAQALRSGIREVVAADDQTQLADAVRRSRELTQKLAGHSGSSAGTNGKVVTVFSSKGGVGKTTLSTNVGVRLAHEGKRTLLVDLDLSFGDVAISLQLLPDQTIFDGLAMSGHLDEQGLASLVTTHVPSGLDVVCAPLDPGDADRVPAHMVSELIKVARGVYDYVVIDTPPSFTEHVLAACDVSDVLVLIATLDIPAVKNLRVALDTLDVLGTPKDARVVVLNRSDTKVGLRPDDVVGAIKQDIAVNIPSSLNVPASINRGVAMVLDEPRHPVSLAVQELVDTHIRARFGEHIVTEQPRKRGLAGLRGNR